MQILLALLDDPAQHAEGMTYDELHPLRSLSTLDSILSHAQLCMVDTDVLEKLGSLLCKRIDGKPDAVARPAIVWPSWMSSLTSPFTRPDGYTVPPGN